MFLFGVLGIFSYDERLVEENLLAFGLADLVLCPYFGCVPFVPIEPCAKRELFHCLAQRMYTTSIYTSAEKSRVAGAR